MGRAYVVLMSSVLLSIAFSGPVAGRDRGELSDLARIQTDFKTKRISSYDRSGGNNDRFENINDGEVRELFNVKGAGMINHIWITIAPVPDQLSRNDIILRMYWDGNPFASVESPIGPFFGQGWSESYPFVSLPLAVGPTEGRAMVSYFVMPFSNGARIEIENQTGKKINAFYYIEHGHNNCLTLDLASVAYWYQAPPLTKLPAIADKESRTPKRFIQPADIHKWRNEWRKSQGSGSQLWGNEK